MTLACPECDAPAPKGAPIGRPFACPSCGNPVLLREDPAAGRAREARRTPRSSARSPAAAPARPMGARAVGLAVATFVVLGAAYVGVYELLVADAKRERDAIVRHHGEAILVALSPGPPPERGNASESTAHGVARERYELRTRHETLSRRVDTFFTALLCAFGLQTAIAVFVVARTSLARRRAVRRGSERESVGPART